MKKFTIIYNFGKYYGAATFEVEENTNSYDKIIENAIIKTIEEKEKYVKIFPNEKDIKPKKTIKIIETEIETGQYVKDGIELFVPWF